MNPLLNQAYMPPQNNQNGMMEKLQQFGSMVNGNPQQIVQDLLRSGKMSQQQFEQYAQTANQILWRR